MTSRSMSVDVHLSMISLQPGRVESVCCPGCGELMNLHQPESGFPDRMLWTCEVCGNWFLMDLVPGGGEAVLVGLPDGDHFLRAAGM